MRTTFIAVLLLLALAPEAARAQEIEFLSSASHLIVPQRRSFSLRSSVQPIRIEMVRARVEILEQAATTTLEVNLVNPGGRQAEAVLLLPVPDGAAVHSFSFQGSAAEPTAKLLPKEEARRIYSSIVAKLRDPALLEFAGYNLVKTSVFPVPAGGRQRVRLTYNHLLPVSGTRIDYVLPRSEALDTAVPWEVLVDLKSKAPIATIYSPSHALDIRRHDPHHMTLRIKENGPVEPGPFRLSALLERDGISATLMAYPDPKIGGGYFLLLAGLPPHSQTAQAQVKREVTLVIDRSGSMAGGNMDQVKKAAIQVIEGLADGEAFNIIDYSNGVSLFAPKPVFRNRDSLLKARAYVDSLRPNGGTNIHDALVEALRQETHSGMLPLVLFLTDGLPTIGQTSEVAIREAVAKGNPHNRRVFTFGVGADVNVPLLDRVSEVSGGAPAYVLPGEDVEVKVAQVFRRLYGPVLADGKLQTLDAAGNLTTVAVRELIPATVPDLFEGDQFVLLGQYRGEQPLTFRLAGSYLGRPREFRFHFDLKSATTRNAFVPRLWASRRIAFLIDQIRQAGAFEGERPALAGESLLNDPRYRELVSEILRLSTEFGILSEYTSFLATEGTDLSDWDKLNLICNGEINRRAVKNRWGTWAVAQGKNVNDAKNQSRLKLYNDYLDSKLRRVQITEVQQSCARGFFRRGDRWIDGRIVAGQTAQTADLVVDFGSAAYATLLDKLVKEGRQALIARDGEVLVQIEGKNVLVRNRFEKK